MTKAVTEPNHVPVQEKDTFSFFTISFIQYALHFYLKVKGTHRSSSSVNHHKTLN